MAGAWSIRGHGYVELVGYGDAMTSANTERLQSILRLSASATAPQMKVALSRLASELKVRSKGAAYSTDYFVSALSALGRIKGTAHAELRMQCVKDCLFYLQ
mgnify:CR=1 FL=1